MAGAPMLDQFLGYDPFEASRAVTRRAAALQPAPELPSGFSMLPGGNLMYAVADDPEKLYAQAMAEYEARTKNPRLQGLDSPERLYQELFAPLDAVYRQNVNPTSLKTFEIGDTLVSFDPQTQRSKVVYQAPPKAEPDLTPRQKLELGDLMRQRNALQSGIGGVLNEQKIADLNKEIEAYKQNLPAMKTPTSAPTVEQKQPKIFFGDANGNPFQTPQVSTNGEAIIKTKSGKTYKLNTH